MCAARSSPPRSTWRCSSCGNRTRFDVFATARTRAFQHFTLGGEMTVEEEEVLERHVERVVCRWCGASEGVEDYPQAGAPEGASPGG